MGKIIGAITISIIGGILIAVALQQRRTDPMINFLLLGGGAELGAFVLFLYGLKSFFISEMLQELKKLPGSGPEPQK